MATQKYRSIIGRPRKSVTPEKGKNGKADNDQSDIFCEQGCKFFKRM